MITNVLNPKVILFNVAFVPQFINPELRNVSLQLAILGALLFLVDFVIDGPIGYFAGSVGQRMTSVGATGSRRIARSVAAIYFALAGWIATTV